MEPGTLRVRSKQDLMWIAIYEVIGTFILLTAIQLSNGINAGPPQVCACIFMAGIFACRVSGAHFNPSVTLVIYLIEAKWKENLPIALTIFVSDLIGVRILNTYIW